MGCAIPPPLCDYDAPNYILYLDNDWPRYSAVTVQYTNTDGNKNIIICAVYKNHNIIIIIMSYSIMTARVFYNCSFDECSARTTTEMTCKMFLSF